MLGLFLVCWVLGPLLILAVSLGCGLLVRRAGGGNLPAVYVLPIGFALAIAIGALLTALDATAELVGPVYVLLAVAGLLLERGSLRRPAGRAWVWPAAAAAVGFAVVAAPVVLSGHATFTGYGRIVDIAHQFDFAAYLSSKGRSVPPVTDSSYLEMATKTLAIGYPGGWQGTLGGFARLLGTDLVWIYQPLLAITSAMTALSLFGLLRSAVESRPLRALAAGAAAQANVLYAYGVVGGFKELSAAFCLVLTAAVLGHAGPGVRWRSAAPAAVAVSASLASLNLTVVPWLGIFLAGFFLLAFWSAPRRLVTVPRFAALAVITVLLSLPTVIEGVKLAPVAAQAEGANRTVLVDLGNLAEPMPIPAAAGIWLARDYRFTSTGKRPATSVLIVLVLALALVGVVLAARRRDWPVVMLGVAAAIALFYFKTRTGPWIQLKAIAISGPMVLACAFAGAGGLRALLSRPGGPRNTAAAALAWVLAGTVALGVFAGNALAYHDTSLAPAKRLRDLEHVGDRLAGQGPTVYPAHEEYAEYFLRKAGATGVVNPPRAGNGFFQPRQDAANRESRAQARGQANYAWDPDELQLSWLEGFRRIVLRRGPSWSRPPSNYELDFRTPYHEVWRKARPASTVLEHLPAPTGRSRAPLCRRFSRAAARRPGTQVAYAQLPPAVPLRLRSFPHPGGWGQTPSGQLLTLGRGNVGGPFRLVAGGRFRVWLAGSFGRAVQVTLDGREVATLKNRHNYPEQYEPVGVRSLDAGRHSLLIARGGGGLGPGNSAGDELPMGPLVLELIVPDGRRVRTAPAGQAQRICQTTPRLDWIESVRPG